MSRKTLVLVFDDFVASTTAVYTAAQHNSLLGQFDKMAFQLVADKTSGTSPTVTVAYEHSADQRNWEQKNSPPEINALSIPAGSTTPKTAYETGANPSNAFGRLKVQLGGTSPEGHIKIWVTARDES
jgi:hypothetical protein